MKRRDFLKPEGKYETTFLFVGGQPDFTITFDFIKNKNN